MFCSINPAALKLFESSVTYPLIKFEMQFEFGKNTSFARVCCCINLRKRLTKNELVIAVCYSYACSGIQILAVGTGKMLSPACM